MLSRTLRVVAVVVAVPLLTALVACGKSNNNPPSTGGNGQVGGAPSGGATTPNTVITTAPPPSPTGAGSPTYPNDARSYANEILKAWGAKNYTRLEALGDLALVTQIKDSVTTGGVPNTQWTYIRCSTSVNAGRTDCTFRNAHGDESVVTLIDAMLGKQDAGIAASLDRTTYDGTPEGYVSDFIGAWAAGNEQRMARLSSSTIKNKFFGHGNAISSQTMNTTPNDATTVIVHVAGIGGDLGRSADFTVLMSPGGKANAIKAGTCISGCS